jgi:phospholipase D1/2
MYPEGIPTSGSVQAILHYQTTTIRAMYKRIGDTLREVGVMDRFPTDYLQFYCLGNREAEGMVRAVKKIGELLSANEKW